MKIFFCSNFYMQGDFFVLRLGFISFLMVIL